jgi:predicted alpha/beta-fold hydrolase
VTLPVLLLTGSDDPFLTVTSVKKGSSEAVNRRRTGYVTVKKGSSEPVNRRRTGYVPVKKGSSEAVNRRRTGYVTVKKGSSEPVNRTLALPVLLLLTASDDPFLTVT